MKVGDKFLVRIDEPKGYSMDGVEDGNVGVVTKIDGGEYWSTITRTDGTQSVDFLIDGRDTSHVVRVGVVFTKRGEEAYKIYVSASKTIAEVKDMLEARFAGIAYLTF